MQLRISQLAESTRVLGPGDRAVIWVHGCCFQCPGCLAQLYKEGPFQSYTPRQLADWFLQTNAQGLTVSGGEPMLQAGALAQVIRLIRQDRPVGVIVYTGFVYEQLLEKNDPDIRALLEQVDVLIDGPYIRELDDGIPYRGSSNQRILALTDRYREELDTYYLKTVGRKIEIDANTKRTMMVGIPDSRQLAIWNAIKSKGRNTK